MKCYLVDLPTLCFRSQSPLLQDNWTALAIMLSAQEVEKHNNRQSCWVIIEDQVYDVTDFIDEHPGGPGIMLRYAGKVGF